MTLTREDEIKYNLSVATIKGVFGDDEIPTKDELTEYSKVQAKRNNLDVDFFIKYVETKIPFQMELGTSI